MKLSELLAGPAPAGVYRAPAGASSTAIEAAAAKAGWRLAPVRTPAAADKRSVLGAFKDALGFPDWFGHNLDAFADCLGDVATEPGVLVVWEGAERFAAADPASYRAVVTILRERGRGLVTLLLPE